MKPKIADLLDVTTEVSDDMIVVRIKQKEDSPPSPPAVDIKPMKGTAVIESGGQDCISVNNVSSLLMEEEREDKHGNSVQALVWHTVDLNTGEVVRRHDRVIRNGINDHFCWLPDGSHYYIGDNGRIIKSGRQISALPNDVPCQWRTTGNSGKRIQSARRYNLTTGRIDMLARIVDGIFEGEVWHVPDGSLHATMQTDYLPNHIFVVHTEDQKWVRRATWRVSGMEDIESNDSFVDVSGKPSNFESHIVFREDKCCFGNQKNSNVEVREVDSSSKLYDWPLVASLSVTDIAYAYSEPNSWIAYTHASMQGKKVLFSVVDWTNKDPDYFHTGIMLWDYNKRSIRTLEKEILTPKGKGWWKYLIKPCLSPDGTWYCRQAIDKVAWFRIPKDLA